ncbi:MAG: adenylyl-sulfate reductase [Gammaproteobacteria bacterium]|nr:MAG: adenylyl-sulfate reductase [Gammaproteobacteria bacterium]
MLTTNPFAEIAAFIPPAAMQVFIILMVLLVVGGTVLDMMHKKSAKYFFENAEKAKKSAKRTVSSGEKAALAAKVLTNEVLTSGEFANPKRRVSHLFTMYGFILFAATTAIMIFGYLGAGETTPGIWPLLWHLGALMLCFGGYWFWFSIRVDVNSEGAKWYKLVPADLFILSLLATCTFALIWSFLQSTGGVSKLSNLFFILFILSAVVLFGGVYFSKFAHMFFKPAAAYQKRVTRADGSRENLPAEYDPADPEVQKRFPDIPMYLGKNPPNMGLGIKREAPNHY